MSDLENLLTSAVLVARRFGAERLLLFGSALENPATARDLDWGAGVPGWKFFELSSALEETLRVPLDLVPLAPPTPFARLIESGPACFCDGRRTEGRKSAWNWSPAASGACSRHGCGFQIEWDRMREGLDQMSAVLAAFRARVIAHLDMLRLIGDADADGTSRRTLGRK